MQIIDDQIDDAALMAIGRDVVQLLRSGEIDVLAARFGYAVALGRKLAVAIRDDLAACLEQIGSAGLGRKIEFDCEVKFFAPNTSSLFAVVDCVVPALNGGDVLIEVVVTSNGRDKYATLEQVSVVN
jgi:hypothetical protein